MSIDKIVAQIDAVEGKAVAAASAAVDAVIAKLVERVEAAEARSVQLEAKIGAAPAIVKSHKSLTAENNSRVKEVLKKFAEGNGRKEVELKLFEGEGHREALAQEASQLVGGGSNKGGRVDYDPFFVSKRQPNVLREIAAVTSTSGSDYQFRAKIGNAGVLWGAATSPVSVPQYGVNINGAATTVDSAIWQLSLKDMNVQFPVRTAFLDDADGYEQNLVADMMLEAGEVEGISMVQNNDQAAASADILGGAAGIRGLDQYASGTVAAYGTSGTASNTGLHTIVTIDQIAGNAAGAVNNIDFRDLVALIHALPRQYWGGDNCFMMSPLALSGLRSLRDTNGAPIFDRNNTLMAQGYAGELLGHKVIVNRYMDAPTSAGTAATQQLFPIYFADFKKFFKIVDKDSMILRRYDQTVPGSITFYMERRLATSIMDPFAGVRLRSTSTGVVVGAPVIGPGQ